MAIRRSIDLRRSKNALRDVFVDALDDVTGLEVFWADKSVPTPTRPFVSLRMDVLPTLAAGLTLHKSTRAAPQDVTATVGIVTAGDLLTLRINGVPFRRTVTGPDTPTTVAAAIVVLINADTELGVTAANALAVITLTPSFTGAIFRVDRFPVGQWTIVENPTTDDVEDLRARKRMTVSVDAFQAPFDSADQPRNLEDDESAAFLADRMRDALASSQNVDALNDVGVSAQPITDVLNLTAPDRSTDREGHANFDVDFFVTSLVTFPINTIDTVSGIVVTVSGNAINITVPVP